MKKPKFGNVDMDFVLGIGGYDLDRWRKKMRGRRTQEEHTKWSCFSFDLQLLSPFIDTSSQGEHLLGKAL